MLKDDIQIFISYSLVVLKSNFLYQGRICVRSISTSGLRYAHLSVYERVVIDLVVIR